jgi:hypothetical protein
VCLRHFIGDHIAVHVHRCSVQCAPSAAAEQQWTYWGHDKPTEGSVVFKLKDDGTMDFAVSAAYETTMAL